ncbi:MAG TPA: hypothetical protein PKE29_12620 [Phycisphaerales bacterium]|nr:hypothetical protein [Phycisphaerales bacterium]
MTAKHHPPKFTPSTPPVASDPSAPLAPLARRRPAAVPGLSSARLAAAMTIAVVSDALSIWLEFIPPIQWGLDIATVALLFLLLGRRWQLLPALVAEAIPGVAAFPFWILAVVAIIAAQRAGRTPPPPPGH